MLWGTQAGATSFVPMTDRNLLDRSAIIVVGVVDAIAAIPGSGTTRYQLDVERVLKGQSSPTLSVALPGTHDLRGGGTWVVGGPRFELDDRVILFLNQRDSGEYVLSEFLLGAFVAVSHGVELLAMRDLSGANALGGQTSPTWQRDFADFADWLAQAGSARERAESVPMERYWRTIAAADGAAKFVLRTPAARFREFENGGSIAWRSHEDGQSGMPGGGVDEFRNALAVWVDDLGSDIQLSYVGTTTQTSVVDGDNIIVFDDPNDEISGEFSCPNGVCTGTIAVNFIGLSDQTHVFNGKTYRAITNNRIVTQNGVGELFLALNDGRNGEETFAHEIGHAVGLDHSCGDTGPCDSVAKDEAVMRANAHADGRGAQLSLDDSAAIAVLYPQPGFALGVPTEVSATDGVFPDRVQLSWTGVAGASSYQVWRGTSNESAQATLLVDTLIASSYTDSTPSADQVYFYFVKAQSADRVGGFSAPDTGFSTVNPQCDLPEITLDTPEPGEVLANDQVTFRWNESSAASEYLVDLSKFPDFQPSLPIRTAATRYTTIPQVQPGIHYWRVYGRNIGNGCDFIGPWSETRIYYIAEVGDLQPTITVLVPGTNVVLPAQQASIDFSGNASDGNGGSIVRVEYRVGGGDWQPANGTDEWTFSVSGLVFGGNLLEIRSQDNSQIFSPVASRTVTRGARPVLTVEQGGGVLGEGETAAEFSGTATDADGSVVAVEYRLGVAGAWQPATGTNMWRFVASGLPGGESRIEIRARDNNAIESETIVRSVTVAATLFTNDFE